MSTAEHHNPLVYVPTIGRPGRAATRWETLVLVVGVCLPVPAFAATGLSFPLPSAVERIAAALVPWADADTLSNQPLARGANGSIILAPNERTSSGEVTPLEGAPAQQQAQKRSKQSQSRAAAHNAPAHRPVRTAPTATTGVRAPTERVHVAPAQPGEEPVRSPAAEPTRSSAADPRPDVGSPQPNPEPTAQPKPNSNPPDPKPDPGTGPAPEPSVLPTPVQQTVDQVTSIVQPVVDQTTPTVTETVETVTGVVENPVGTVGGLLPRLGG